MFAYKLCLELGYPHPDYLFGTMRHPAVKPPLTSSQFDGWRAFYRVEPFGDKVNHGMQARLCAMWGSSESSIEDFMPGMLYQEPQEMIGADDPDAFAVGFGIDLKRIRELQN